MEELCPNCLEDIKEAGKCSKCDGLYCENCSEGENKACPHCGSENGWVKF